MLISKIADCVTLHRLRSLTRRWQTNQQTNKKKWKKKKPRRNSFKKEKKNPTQIKEEEEEEEEVWNENPMKHNWKKRYVLFISDLGYATLSLAWRVTSPQH